MNRLASAFGLKTLPVSAYQAQPDEAARPPRPGDEVTLAELMPRYCLGTSFTPVYSWGLLIEAMGSTLMRLSYWLTLASLSKVA